MNHDRPMVKPQFQLILKLSLTSKYPAHPHHVTLSQMNTKFELSLKSVKQYVISLDIFAPCQIFLIWRCSYILNKS